MKVTIDIKYFIPAIIALLIAYATITSNIDKYIKFAGEANAAAFFFLSAFLGCCFMIGAFIPDKK